MSIYKLIGDLMLEKNPNIRKKLLSTGNNKLMKWFISIARAILDDKIPIHKQTLKFFNTHKNTIRAIGDSSTSTEDRKKLLLTKGGSGFLGGIMIRTFINWKSDESKKKIVKNNKKRLNKKRVNKKRDNKKKVNKLKEQIIESVVDETLNNSSTIPYVLNSTIPINDFIHNNSSSLQKKIFESNIISSSTPNNSYQYDSNIFRTPIPSTPNHSFQYDISRIRTPSNSSSNNSYQYDSNRFRTPSNSSSNNSYQYDSNRFRTPRPIHNNNNNKSYKRTVMEDMTPVYAPTSIDTPKLPSISSFLNRITPMKNYTSPIYTDLYNIQKPFIATKADISNLSQYL